MFHHPSRSSQLTIMKDLLFLKNLAGEDVGVYINKIDECFQELEAAGFTQSMDMFRGIIYQLGLSIEYSGVLAALNAILRSEPHLPIRAKEVEDVIPFEDHHITWSVSNNMAPSLSVVSGNLASLSFSVGSCRSPALTLFNVGQGRSINPSPYQPPASVGMYVPLSRLGGSPQVSMFMCYFCGGPNHWAQACPYNPTSTNFKGNQLAQDQHSPSPCHPFRPPGHPTTS